MLETRDYRALWLVHKLTPAGPIPTVADPDGCYPYESFVETSRRPVLCEFSCIEIENNRLRVLICPDLGGRVHSIIDKHSGREMLFVPETIKPVRVLPRFAFVPGGIEVSFPISHTPVQIERVHVRTEKIGDRVYVWVGERELRHGLQWTVEFSLGECDAFLTQRCFFRNPTTTARKWTSWSNAAVPAQSDTEFHFPNGPVLAHGKTVGTIDWATAGPGNVGNLARMTGFFWLRPDSPGFGVFTPSLGCGMYHVADPDSVPGMKLWSYGTGQHEEWGALGSLSGKSYVEIQGGPLPDQSVLRILEPGRDHTHTEFWFPTRCPMDIRQLTVPNVCLAGADRIPWFDWPPRAAVHIWTQLADAWRTREPGRLPSPPHPGSNWWAPSGMEELGDALEWAAKTCGADQRDIWMFQRGAWFAGREDIESAIAALNASASVLAHVLLARLHLRCRQNATEALASLERISGSALALHPQVIVERDMALAAQGPQTMSERERWLALAGNSEDEWVIERRAALLADQGKKTEALALLEGMRFQKIHQRYARSALWQQLTGVKGNAAGNTPESLGEDDLACFGAYRQFDTPKGA